MSREEDTIHAVTAALTMPPKVWEALQHVRKVYPDVVQVTYNGGYWAYSTIDGHFPFFDWRIDLDFLEEVEQEAVHEVQPGVTYYFV